MLNSYTRGATQQNRNLNDSKNSSILPPEITSTPFHSPCKTRTSPLVTPTRKILGPRRYALSSNGMLSPLKTIKDPPGPLLAATNYNVNVSTYIDTKSPGYASRLVQYNEESSRNQQHTHQEKYGSPGLFPIVHLFKKDIPVITPKSKRGTIRIGTPELKGHYSQDHNRLLLEGIVRSNSVIKEHNQSNDVSSTRSVLDALKEISRKRIHASEEYELSDESHKKLRRDCVNGEGDSAKRNRVDSPTSDTSVSPPSRQAVKKLCTIDAVLASRTSSMYAGYESGSKRKTTKSSEEEMRTKISPASKKKFTNAETQTSIVPVRDKVTDVETLTKDSENKKDEAKFPEQPFLEEVTSPPKQILKVFDDKPLEIIRKNRLGALLSALTGQEIPPIPMEDRRKALDQEWPPQKTDKKLVSILSPQNKGTTKSVEKHVTFNIPDTSNSSQSNDSESTSTSVNQSKVTENKSNSQLCASSTTDNNLKTKDDNIQTNITTNVVPIVNNGAKPNANVPGLGSFAFGVPKVGSTETKTPSIGGFKFDLTKASDSPTKLSSDLNSSSATSTSNTVTTTTSKSPLQTDKITFSSPPPNGSFTSNILPKFGEISSKPETTPSLSSTKSLFDNTATKTSATVNSLGLPSALPPLNSTPAFGISSPSTSFNFAPSTSAINLTTNTATKATPAFNPLLKEILKPPQDGSTITSNIPIGSTPSMPTFATQKTPVSSPAAPLFNSNSLGMTSNSVAVSQSISSNVTFGVETRKSDLSSPKMATTGSAGGSSLGPFGTSIPSQGTTSKPATPQSQNLFTMSTPAPFMGVQASPASTSLNFVKTTTTKAGGFSFNSGNPLPAFGTTTTTTAASSGFAQTSIATTSNTFGITAPISSSASPFGGNKAANLTFGTTPATTSLPLTSSTTTPMFGTTPSNSFGATPSLISTDTTKPFTFSAGNNQPFNNNLSTSTSTSPMFTLKNSQSGMTLGTNTTASTASNLSFGSTSTPTFGTPSNKFPSEGFAQTTTVPSFGGSNATTTFGAVTTTSSFGSSSSLKFGAPNTTAPAFGTTSVPSFGAPNNTTGMFNGTATPSFGNANSTAPGFGTTNSTLAFGAPPPTTTALSFGTSNNKPTFGVVTTSSMFGASATPTFGNATTSAPGFGTTNTATFGSSNAFKVPSFGSTSAPFGVATTTSINTFNSNTNAAPFGSPPTTNSFGGFGATNPSPFNPVTSTSTFGNISSNNFGTSNATGNTFGSTNGTSNTFGSTNGGSNFGVPNASNNNFGTSNPTNSPFGGAAGSNNAFGSTPGSNNAFGNTPSINTTFGTTPSSTNNFGNNNMPNSTFSFGANSKPVQSASVFPNQTNNMFSNSTFGTSNSNNNNNQATNSSVFTFGSPNAQSSSSAGVFAFGAGDTQPKAFNFSAPGTSGSAPSLGAPAPTANGFSAIPAFGQASAGVPNMFSIGSGTSSSTQNRGRPHVRAKRRT